MGDLTIIIGRYVVDEVFSQLILVVVTVLLRPRIRGLDAPVTNLPNIACSQA
mgnify:CR=1 FL=1|jgi:hypothetical protein